MDDEVKDTLHEICMALEVIGVLLFAGLIVFIGSLANWWK